MVKAGRQPGGCAVTGTTRCAKRPGMMIIFFMAGITVGCRGFKDVRSGVALGTNSADVRTGQFEGRIIVVEDGWLPGLGRMAAFAGCAFGAAMRINSLVTTKAGGGCVVEFWCG
jgi:hypothetical protein